MFNILCIEENDLIINSDGTGEILTNNCYKIKIDEKEKGKEKEKERDEKNIIYTFIIIIIITITNKKFYV